MKFILLFIFSIGIILASGCAATKKIATQPTDTTPANSLSKRYLALGDSYTIGQGVAAEARWPNQLAARLREKGLTLEDPTLIAQTGWTTTDLVEAIKNDSPSGPYDLVTLLIGVNDQYQGATAEEYRSGFSRVLDQAIALAGNNSEHVFVMSLPDWGQAPFAEGQDRNAISAAIDQFNLVNQSEAKRAGVRYSNITEISRTDAGDRTNFVSDGLHPSEKAYAAWVDQIIPEAAAILSTPTETERAAVNKK